MTEDLFGDMAKAEEGKFDAFAPENVAPLVAFLATDEAADVNGQNFVVYGGSVWVMQGWQPAGQVTVTGAGPPRSSPTTRRRCSPPGSRASPPSPSEPRLRDRASRPRGARVPSP